MDPGEIVMPIKKGSLVRNRLGRSILVTTMVLVLLLVPPSAAAFPLWGDSSVGMSVYHQVNVLQGDDPSTSFEEDRRQVMVIDRSYWYVPWDSDEIYTYVHPGARNVTFDHVKPYSHQGSTIYISGDFSAIQNPDSPPAIGPKEGEGFEGYHYWRFGDDAERDLVHALNFTSETDFEDADPELTSLEEWNFTDGELSLAVNVSTATYVSKVYRGGVDLVSVNATLNATGMDNMTLEVTADNGTSWQVPEPGVKLGFDHEGNEFRWRVTMTQDTDLNNTPVLDWLDLRTAFTPEFTELLMETTYVLDMDSKVLEFNQVYPFDINTTTYVLICYIDEDMTLEVTGTEVNKVPSSSVMGKDTYTHMTGGHDQIITFKVTDVKAVQEEGGDTTFWMYVIVGALVLLMAVGIGMVLLSDKRRTPTSEGESPKGPDSDA
ncbi:MAG: hypothetical protein JSW25_00305, partial [Thermoplasmata archaeon]